MSPSPSKQTSHGRDVFHAAFLEKDEHLFLSFID
jgi:hypothetical protein